MLHLSKPFRRHAHYLRLAISPPHMRPRSPAALAAGSRQLDVNSAARLGGKEVELRLSGAYAPIAVTLSCQSSSLPPKALANV